MIIILYHEVTFNNGAVLVDRALMATRHVTDEN